MTVWNDLLQKTCIIVGKAADGVTALELIRQLKPDVAVLDITMPRLNGTEVARTAIEEQPMLGVVLCSVMHDPLIIQAAVEAGVRGYVLKMNLFHGLANAVAAVAAGGSYFPSVGLNSEQRA